MLVLRRTQMQIVDIGEDIEIQVVRISDGSVRLGITAPKHLRVDRREISERIKQEAANKDAA